MKPSNNAVQMIAQFEGLKLKSYKCLPTEKMFTIGYGHYGVEDNLTITKEQAEEYLKKDMWSAELEVNKYQGFYNFNQNQYDALVSFAFNLGSIHQLTQKGTRSRDGIAIAMLLYNKSGGKVIAGLTKRRKKEQALYNTPMANTLKTIDDIAKEVIAGKWGVGAMRRQRLTKAGYKSYDVQMTVNNMLK